MTIKTPYKILFICTHNACRSILAEAICRQLAGNNIVTASAGSHPAGKIFPETLSQLTQHNYNIENLHSKSWDELSEFDADIVITVCDQAAGESCPVWFGNAIKVHWGLNDASKVMDRAARQQSFNDLIQLIETRMNALLKIDLAKLSTVEIHHELERIGAIN